MSTTTHDQTSGLFVEEIKQARKSWGWLLALGIVQIVVGVVAVCFAFNSTIATVVALGVLLTIAAGAQLALAILAHSSRSFFLFLLLSVLYGVAGFLTLAYPMTAAETLTLLLAAMFLVGGIFRILVSLISPFPGWGWVLANGVITTLLGILIVVQWPGSGLWVLGMFLGIDLIANGLTWSAAAITVRKGLAELVKR